MNTATTRSVSRLCVNARQLTVRCSSSQTFTPHSAASAPKFESDRNTSKDKPKNRHHGPRYAGDRDRRYQGKNPNPQYGESSRPWQSGRGGERSDRGGKRSDRGDQRSSRGGNYQTRGRGGSNRGGYGSSSRGDHQGTAPAWKKDARFPGPGTKTETVADRLVPQLSPEETSSIFAQELFVFRADVINNQIASAMSQYTRLRDYGIITSNDVSDLMRQIHNRFRNEQDKLAVLPYIKTLIDDFKAGTIAGHPLASVHIISTLKDMEEFAKANEFWAWCVEQDVEMCDARTYGAAIECMAYQGAPLADMEALWRQAFDRYSNTTVPSVARDTGRGVPLMLLQGIITARLFHGDWRAAYEGFDISVRLYPTLTPARFYELFIYERPLKEAYIVFLMACRAGCPPKPAVLVPLLKEIWLKTCDVRAMIRLLYNYVGAGGKPGPNHLNILIGGILGSFPKELQRGSPGYDETYKATITLVRTLIAAFVNLGTRFSTGTFNTIISLGGKLNRPELIQSALQQMQLAHIPPDLITHRILLNTVADLKQSLPTLTATWNMTKSFILEQERIPYGIHDWRPFLRAATATKNLSYFRDELEAAKHHLGPQLYTRLLSELQRSFLGHTHNPPPPDTPAAEPDTSAEALQQTINELKRLETIFSSNTIKDFSRDPADSLFSLNPAAEPADVETHYPEQLREMYSLLAPPNKHAEDLESTGTGTSTGYNVDGLRFENWKAVNRLLFEAEVAEKEEEMRILAKVRGASKGMLEEDDKTAKEKRIGWERTFWNEEVVHRKLRKVLEGREGGKEGWRREEMSLRGGCAKVDPAKVPTETKSEVKGTPEVAPTPETKSEVKSTPEVAEVQETPTPETQPEVKGTPEVAEVQETPTPETKSEVKGTPEVAEVQETPTPETKSEVKSTPGVAEVPKAPTPETKSEVKSTPEVTEVPKVPTPETKSEEEGTSEVAAEVQETQETPQQK